MQVWAALVSLVYGSSYRGNPKTAQFCQVKRSLVDQDLWDSNRLGRLLEYALLAE